MTRAEALERGTELGKWARSFYGAADLAVWAREQGLKSEAADALGANVDADMYAMACKDATRRW